MPPTRRRFLQAATMTGAGLGVFGLCAALGKEPNDPLDGFDEFARTAITDWKVPGLSIAVVKDGKVALARGYGVCRIGENTAVDERTVFRIVSCTKSFTATCLGMLVDDGKHHDVFSASIRRSRDDRWLVRFVLNETLPLFTCANP